MLKLSIKFIDWVAHISLSHLFNIISLLNLSSPRRTVGKGPLKNTSIFKHRTLFIRSVKSCFNTSDCCFTTSRAPMCMMRDLAVGCSAAMFRILFETSDTMSLVKQSTLVFLLQKRFISFTAPSPTIRVCGPVVSSFCSLLAYDLASYLSLVLEDEPSFGESGF